MRKKEGFTLVEIIVVLTIFGIVGLVAVTTFLTAFRIGQRSTIENAILDDARFIMNTIAQEIQAGTIDYEEYFNQCVVSGTCPNWAAKPEEADFIGAESLGNNHGYYNWQFKFGGWQKSALDSPAGIQRIDGFGTVCQDSNFAYHNYPHVDEVDPTNSCITGPLTFSEDNDTGENPNPNWDTPRPSDAASALCAIEYQDFTDIEDVGITVESALGDECTAGFYEDLTKYAVDELYLIDASGNKKTILVSEQINGSDKALAKVEMVKSTQAEDDDGRSLPLFVYECAEGYLCNDAPEEFANGISYPAVNAPLRTDPYDENYDAIYDDFVPISPLRVNVKKLKFIITPLEDPRRAFGELDENIQVHPQVTILMELEPSTAFRLPFISDRFNLKLQTTVSAGVLTEVPITSDI